MHKVALSVSPAILIGTATTARSQSVSPDAPNLDPAWKVPQVMASIGLRKVDKVAEIAGGRPTASPAQAVDPSGKVYAVATAEVCDGCSLIKPPNLGRTSNRWKPLSSLEVIAVDLSGTIGV